MPRGAARRRISPADAPPSAWSYTAAYTGDLLADISGGRGRGGGYADLLKLSAAYDGSTSGREGLTGLVSVEHTFGSMFTANRVGAVQTLSGNEARPKATRLYEAWLQQEVMGGAAAVKVGIIDLNTTFDVQETAALFLNGSDGAGADLGDTGLNGPSITSRFWASPDMSLRPTPPVRARILGPDLESSDTYGRDLLEPP